VHGYDGPTIGNVTECKAAKIMPAIVAGKMTDLCMILRVKTVRKRKERFISPSVNATRSGKEGSRTIAFFRDVLSIIL
jgi:hypothetical protein